MNKAKDLLETVKHMIIENGLDAVPQSLLKKAIDEAIAQLEEFEHNYGEHIRLHKQLCNIIFAGEEQPKQPSLCDLVAYVQVDYEKFKARETKSCEGCKHKNTINLESDNIINGYCLENGFFTKIGFCCNKYEPKDNQ